MLISSLVRNHHRLETAAVQQASRTTGEGAGDEGVVAIVVAVGNQEFRTAGALPKEERRHAGWRLLAARLE